MKPLLLMRKKGLAGPMYSKHCGIKGLSKSAGAYIDGPGEVFRVIKGYTGDVGCGGGVTIPYKVVFSEPVYFSNYAGVNFYNVTKDIPATGVSTPLTQGLTVLEYTLYWAYPPSYGDVIEFRYAGGDYGNAPVVDVDRELLPDTTINMINCSLPSFDFVMRTTADNETITLPATGTNDCVIDWGDGNFETVTTVSPAHVYATAGDHTISITGTVTKFGFANGGDAIKLISVSNQGIMGWSDLVACYYGCINLESYVAGNTDTNGVLNLTSYLRDIGITVPPSIKGMNTSQCLSFYSMFNGLTNMTSPIDLKGLDISSATTVTYMFSKWESVLTPPDISGLDFSGCSDLSGVFNRWLSCEETLKLTGMDFSNGTVFFSFCANHQSITTPFDLTGLDFSKGEDFSSMFANMYSVTTPMDVSPMDVSSGTNFSSMLSGMGLNSNIGAIDLAIDTWDISNATNMTGFLTGVELTTECYDRTLIAWSQLPVQPDVVVGFGDSKYTPGGAAEAARDILTNEPNRWVISDGGGV